VSRKRENQEERRRLATAELRSTGELLEEWRRQAKVRIVEGEKIVGPERSGFLEALRQPGLYVLHGQSTCHAYTFCLSLFIT
jgi:hypothetical protein